MKKDTTHGGYLSGPFTSLDAVAGTGCKATTETVTRLPDHWSSNEVKLGACPDGPWVQLRDYQGALSELDTLLRQLAEAEEKAALNARMLVEELTRNEHLEAKLALAEQDGKRLDWLIRRISGKALRAIGVVWPAWSEESSRTAIDAAIAAGEGLK